MSTLLDRVLQRIADVGVDAFFALADRLDEHLCRLNDPYPTQSEDDYLR